MKPSKLAWVVPVVFAAALGAGCAQNNQSPVAEVPPYVGHRPPPMRPLQPPPPKLAKQGVAAACDQAWTPPRGVSNRWQCIVIHHSGSDKSTPEGMRQWHVQGRGWDDLGYHFVIGNGRGYGDGQVFVGGRWTQQKHGAHCKTRDNYYNDHGVGICLIGDLERHPPTPRQIEALARLTTFLASRCHIPRSRILTHGGVTHKTACPGRYFHLAALLQKFDSRTASADFEDDDRPLTDFSSQ